MKNINDFNSGLHVKRIDYKSFSPEKINEEWVISDNEISGLLSEADQKIGALNAYSMLIPDVEFFIKMHVLKEATSSGKIEGTQTNMEEALVDQKDVEPEKRDDWAEVNNYIKALNYSIDELEKLPISSRLFQQIHGMLLDSVRGRHKVTGEYRKSQNWIGGTLKSAQFVPPHHSEVNDLMSDLEKFIHNDDFNMPHLIKVAMIHYQFETIHPFLDGNGRLGRLMIILYLVHAKVLNSPTLYLSDFFERNKGYYYDSLMQVRQTSDMKQWLRFFLGGVIETASKSIKTFEGIIKLRQDIEGNRISHLTGVKLENTKKVIQYLWKSPMIGISDVEKLLEVSTSTASRLVKDFESMGILKKFDINSRTNKYVFHEYFALFH